MNEVLDEETKTVIVTGKGGVGKSTVSSAIALANARDGMNVLGVDMDGSPSMSDAFGESDEMVDQNHNKLVQISLDTKGSIRVALLSEMIPHVGGSHREKQKKYEKEVERLSAGLIPDKIDGKESYAPVLLLALQSVHFGIPVETKNLAHIVQLAEMYANKRHLVSDFESGKERAYAQSIADVNRFIFDTENTNNLIHLVESLRQLVDIVTDVAGRDPIGRLVANTISMYYKIMKQYMRSNVSKKPEGFAAAAGGLQEEIMGCRTKVLCVTNPGLTEVSKTIRDVERILRTGRAVDAVIMNRWPSDPLHQTEAAKAEKSLLESLDAFGSDMSFHRVEIPGEGLHIVSPSEARASKKQRDNIGKMAEALGF